MIHDEDHRLWMKIQHERSADAFSELFERHAPHALTMACFLARDRDVAEEVLQETMLDLWRARKGPPPQNVRAWIFRVVAHKSIDILRSRRKESKRMNGLNRAEDLPSPNPGPDQDWEKQLLSGRLKRLLDELPDVDRQLVVLHYGCEFSNREIGAMLSIPPRTVSWRIQRVLGSLRKRLVEAGFSVVGPVLTTSLFEQAILQGSSPPRWLLDNILSQISLGSPARSTRRLPSTSGAGVGLSTVFMTSILVGALALAGSWWFQTHFSPQREALSAQQASDSKEASLALFSWDFRSGHPDGMEKPFIGKWHYKEGGMGFGQPGGILVLPSTPPQESFVLSVTANHCAYMAWRPEKISAGWTDLEGLVPFSKWQVAEQPVSEGCTVHRFAFMDSEIIHYVEHQVHAIYRYGNAFARNRICVEIQNTLLTKIEIHALGGTDIPVPWVGRDKAFWDEAARAFARRSGRSSFQAQSYESFSSVRARFQNYYARDPLALTSASGSAVYFEPEDQNPVCAGWMAATDSEKGWEQGSSAPAAQQIVSKRPSTVFSAPVERLPVQVSYSTMASADCFDTEVIWSDRVRRAVFRDVSAPGVQEGRWIPVRHFVDENSISTFVDQRLVAVSVYEDRDQGAPYLELQVNGKCRVNSVAIRAIEASMLPDVNSYRRAVAQVPPGKRRGLVTLPSSAHHIQNTFQRVLFETPEMACLADSKEN